MIDAMHLDGVRALDDHIKKMKHLYYCKVCTRSYHSNHYHDSCKFCGSNVVELNGHKKQKDQPHRFFCPVCDKSTISKDMLSSCPKCGNNNLHSYPIEKMWKREFFSIRKRQICDNIMKTLRNSVKKK